MTGMPLSLIVKLGSLVTHVQEATSLTAHTTDFSVCKTLAEDPEVVEWLGTIDPAFLPVKR